MTLDEAITNLECLEQSEEAGLEDDEKMAIKLGIEAFQAVKFVRRNYPDILDKPLPGETKD